MAEWSKAPVSGTGLYGGVGSNPTSCILNKQKHYSYYENKYQKIWPLNMDSVCAILMDSMYVMNIWHIIVRGCSSAGRTTNLNSTNHLVNLKSS